MAKSPFSTPTPPSPLEEEGEGGDDPTKFSWRNCRKIHREMSTKKWKGFPGRVAPPRGCGND